MLYPLPLPSPLPPSSALCSSVSSWSNARCICSHERRIPEMAPLRSSRCADPVGEIAPCWQLQHCRFDAVALSKSRDVLPHVISATHRVASGDGVTLKNHQQLCDGNASALQVLASRELLEHIADYMRGVPNLVVDFVKQNDNNASLPTIILSPFHDDESATNGHEEHWSACYDPQATNGLVTRLALQKDDRRVLHMLLRLHQFPVYRRMRKLRLDMAVVWSVELGRLHILEWLQPQLPAHIVASLQSTSSKARLLNAAVRNGDVEMMQWIQQHYSSSSKCCLVASEAIQNVPKERMLEVIRWLHIASQHSFRADDGDDEACFCGDVFSEELVNPLAEIGCLDAIQFLHNELSSTSVVALFSVATMDTAARAGHLKIVQFLHRVVRLESCNTSAIDAAAQRGHLQVVKFLHSHRREGCTTAAMDGAAANGHLDVVQFLHLHRQEGCTVAAMDLAARNGHLKIVQFLSEHRREGCTSAAMDQAALFGHLDVIQHLHQSPAVSLCSSEAMDNAAITGHLEIVRFLHEHRSEGCTTNAMDLAAQNGHLPVIQFLHEHRIEGCTRAAMNLAAQNGQLEIVQFLHEHRQEGCTKRALSLAARNGFTLVVKFLVEHRREGCAEDALRSAYRSGRFEVARYLHQRGFMGNVSKCVISCCCPTVLQYS